MAPDFGEPDADWTDDFGWVRHRGPQAYPVPADWVLGMVDGDGMSWHRFPGIGEGLGRHDEVRDALDHDSDAIEEHRDVRASLSKEVVEFHEKDRTATVAQELSIDGQRVFRRVSPDTDDVFAATAEALARYSNGQDLDDVAPSTGHLPEEDQRKREIEQRQEENQALDAFAGGVDDVE